MLSQEDATISWLQHAAHPSRQQETDKRLKTEVSSVSLQPGDQLGRSGKRQCRHNWNHKSPLFVRKKSGRAATGSAQHHQQEAAALCGYGPHWVRLGRSSRLLCSGTYDQQRCGRGSRPGRHLLLHLTPSGGLWDLGGMTLRHRVLGPGCGGAAPGAKGAAFILSFVCVCVCGAPLWC